MPDDDKKIFFSLSHVEENSQHLINVVAVYLYNSKNRSTVHFVVSSVNELLYFIFFLILPLLVIFFFD